MDTKEISLSIVESNPFNSRLTYDERETQLLANSLAEEGLLSPVSVREKAGKYEIIFGHRRVQAAKLLGWRSIRADVRDSVSDEKMLRISLVENLARSNLSDYEIALCLQKMIKDFGKTQEQIAKLIGFSKSHVCNYLRMLSLVADEQNDPQTQSYIRSISEHHARLLLQIEKPSDRSSLLKLIAEERLSVRDVQRIVHGLRGWFTEEKEKLENTFPILDNGSLVFGEARPKAGENTRAAHDLVAIQKALEAEFSLPHDGDFNSFARQHAFDSEFSIFSEFAPFDRFEGTHGYEKVKKWFYSIAPTWSTKIRDVRVQFIDSIALTTLYVTYNRGTSATRTRNMRGTVVFQKRKDSWKIMHEHWSEIKRK